MARRWWWLTAGTLLILLTTAVTATASGFAARAWRYVDRTTGLTATGRASRFDLRWAQAKAQYAERLPRDYSYGTLYRTDYPAKAQLLTELDRVHHALHAAFQTGRPEPFHVDLLLSLDPEFAREVLRAYLEQGDCGYAPAVQQALAAVFPTEELKRTILALDGPCKEFAFHTLPREAADPAFMEQLITPYLAGTVPAYILDHPTGFQVALAHYPSLSRAGKLGVIRAHSRHQLTPPPEWLATETDPAVRQELLFQAKDEAGLLAAIERDGAFAENSFWGNIGWERSIALSHPDSFLARGARAYEAVRGRAYFHIDRLAQGQPMWEYGNQQYDCNREIPGWEAYLRDWSRHPGAGDAAYRLGRCYEITGQYALALQRFYTGITLPDGSMRYHSQGRIVWLLDALLTESDLESLITAAALPDELWRATDYSLALRQMRTGHYDQAVVQFDAMLAKAPPDKTLLRTGPRLWEAVRQQRDKAARLASLQAAGTPEALYDLAAAIYHDELVFYNQLWSGGRTTYVAYYGGHAFDALEGDMDPAYTRWFTQSNNYVQAAHTFAKLEGAPEAVAVKALYSRGLALTRLADSYNADIVLWQTRSSYVRQAEQMMRTVAERYPRHELAPDALLTLGYLTRDRAYFDRILREYPKSTAAVTARMAKPDARGTTSWVPFRYLRIEEAPPAIAGRLREQVARGANATIDFEGQTYVLVTAKEDRQTGRIGFYDTGEGRIKANVIWEDDPDGLGYVLVRTNLITDFLEIHQTHAFR